MAPIFQVLLRKVTHFSCRLFGTQVSEDVKVPVSRARRDLYVCHSVHIIPVAIALYLIIINLQGRYIGAHLGGSGSESTDSVVLAFIHFSRRSTSVPSSSKAAIMANTKCLGIVHHNQSCRHLT